MFQDFEQGASMRICIPDWNSFRFHATFENSGFAKNKQKLKHSHKWFWGNTELKSTLRRIGFKNVIECAFKQGDFPDLECLEHRKGLIIQAQKPY